MKKSLLVSLFFFASVISAFSQVPDAFSYQAVVRNSAGEVIANQNVSFQISILQTSENGTAVYVETHSATTNKFGLVSLEIGHGNVISGVFNPGGWTADKHFIKVEFDPSGGTSFTQMGTSQLLAVPYAFQAKTVEIDNVDDADADPTNEIQNLSLSGSDLSISGGNTLTLPASTGLEKITEGGNTGWRLIGQDPANHGDIGSDALDLSVGTSASTKFGATNLGSVAMGVNTEASGDYSTAMGVATLAQAYKSTAIGYLNIGGGNAHSWVSTDPLFEIGNGSPVGVIIL